MESDQRPFRIIKEADPVLSDVGKKRQPVKAMAVMAGSIALTSDTSEGNTHTWGRFVGVGMCLSPGRATILLATCMSIVMVFSL